MILSTLNYTLITLFIIHKGKTPILIICRLKICFKINDVVLNKIH